MPGEFRVMRNAALLVGVVALAVFSLSTTDAGTVTVTLDVTVGQQGFSSCMYELQRQATLTSTKPAIEKRVVLGQQKAKPDNWAHLTSVGEFRTVSHCNTEWSVGLEIGIKGGIKSMSEVSLDNLYLVVFKTSSAWYAFKGKDRLIAGSTARSEVMQAWDKGGHVGETAVLLTVKWKEVSCALLQWNKSKKWDSDYAKKIKNLGDPVMKTAEAAATNIFLILQVAYCL